MDTTTLYEIIGYVGSGLVVISLMMRNILKLRVINLIGALIFTIYGVLIEAWPVVGLNGAIVLIDAYYLRQMLPQKPDYYGVVEASPSSELVHRFLDFHDRDIKQFVPSWKGLTHEHRIFVVLRNAVPAGVVVARELDERPGEVAVDLDYVVPEHRTFQLGEWVYEKSGVFRRNGWTTIHARSGEPSHAKYLERMGFTAGSEGFHHRTLA